MPLTPSLSPKFSGVTSRSRAGFGAALSLVASLVVFAPAGCTSNGDDSGNAPPITCTPNNNVFCLCEDGAQGTKPCLADGHSFGSCRTGRGGECAREVPSEDTGKPVDDAGQVIEEEDAGPTGSDQDAPPVSTIEACPGLVFGIPGDTDILVEGNTQGSTDDARGQGACSISEQGPDHVYRLKPAAKGKLSLKVKGEPGMNPTVYLRSACEDESTQLKCAETTGAGGTETISSLNVKTGEDYYLFIDSAAGSAGKYTITARLTSGYFCGDDDVNTNEACDDGNHVDGDGCSSNCLEPNGDPPSGDACPGQPVHVWPGKTVQATGSTLTYTNAWKNTGTSCTVSTNELNKWPEHIYQVTPHANGKLRVTLTPDAADNLMLIARTSCTDPKSQSSDAMCANSGTAGGTETMLVPVTSGVPLFVAVDGAGSSASTKSFSISFAIQ